jgi:hypothetical protein
LKILAHLAKRSFYKTALACGQTFPKIKSFIYC